LLIMEDFKKRMLIERFNLTESIERFDKFIESKEYNDLAHCSHMHCNIQRESMEDYQCSLTDRIHLLIDKKDIANYELNPEFDFGTAIRLLKEGRLVRRTAWNDDRIIIKQIPAKITEKIIPNMQSLPDSAKQIILATIRKINYRHQLLQYSTETGIADNYIPSVEDIYADDWFEAKL